MSRTLIPLGLLLLALAAGCGGPSLLYEGRGDLHLEPIEFRLIRITPAGLEPAGPLRLDRFAGGVAFHNELPDRVVSVVFAGHVFSDLRCSYTSGFLAAGPATFTSEPLAPGGTASLCLHDAGAHAFSVYGAGEEPWTGAIEVAP